MRTSQKTMLLVISVLAVIIVTVIVAGRFTLLKKVPIGPLVNKVFDFSNFDSITIEGNIWDVRIEQNNNFHVEITYPDYFRGKFDIRVLQNELIVTGPTKKIFTDIKNKMIIKAPSIKSLNLEGMGFISFGGFHEKTMNITSRGIMDVRTENSSTDYLEVNFNGIGELDLRGISAVDAFVIHRGLGSTLVNMNGGILNGNLIGMGSIYYKGNVTSEEIEVEGLGSVEYDTGRKTLPIHN